MLEKQDSDWATSATSDYRERGEECLDSSSAGSQPTSQRRDLGSQMERDPEPMSSEVEKEPERVEPKCVHGQNNVEEERFSDSMELARVKSLCSSFLKTLAPPLLLRGLMDLGRMRSPSRRRE
jgi:hypothetical protein